MRTIQIMTNENSPRIAIRAISVVLLVSSCLVERRSLFPKGRY